MRLLRWVCIGFPLLLLLIATLLWGLLHSIDREVYQQALETKISKLTGREFQISGELGVELSPRPALVAGGVSLANAPWGSRGQMLKLGHLRMELALRPLLDGRISISKIIASDLDLLLERGPEGESNWHFEGAQDGGGQKMAGDGFALWDIHQVIARRAKLTIKPEKGGEPVHINAEALRMRSADRNSPLEIYLKGEVLERSFVFSGAMENMSRLLANETVTVRGKAVHGNSALSFQGELEQPLNMGGVDVRLSGSGPELLEIAPEWPPHIASLPYQFEFSAKTDASRWILNEIQLGVGGNSLSGNLTVDLGNEKEQFEAFQITVEGPEIGALFPTLPFWLRALPYQLSVVATGDLKHWDLKKIQLAAGANELTGNLTVDLSGKRPRVEGGLHATRLELPDPMVTDTEVAQEPLDGAAGGLFSAEDIDSEILLWADGNLVLEVESLKNALLPVKDLHAKLKLENGQLQISALRLAAVGGTLTAAGSIYGKDLAQFSLKARGKKLDLFSLSDGLGLDADKLNGKVDFSLDLDARGRSPAMLAKSLNGDVKFLLTDGRIQADMHEYLVGGLSTVLSTFFSGQEDASTIHCAVAHMRFQQGIGESLVLVVDTEHSLLKGKGKLNLREESLDFLVEPKPKGVTLNLGVPLRIQGPIREPAVSPQAFGAARKIGGLLGIMFFPPAALLGLGELGVAEAPACSEALREK